MRIVSLVPAGSEWVSIFGAADNLCGRSHECNYPREIQDIPVLTSSNSTAGNTSSEIDNQVRDHLKSDLSLFNIDIQRLVELSPDLVISETQCEVCAVSEEELSSTLSAISSKNCDLFSFSPSTFKEVLDEALRLGQKVGQGRAAMEYVARKERALQRLKQRLRKRRRPSVVAIEWMDPLMVAGYWTPDLIKHAGGVSCLADAGASSQYISWDELADVDPEVLCLIPCGFDLSQIKKNMNELTTHPQWANLQAVRRDQVYAFDSDAYFNRPGPRLYRSIELLARALHTHHIKDLVSSPTSKEMARIRCKSLSQN